MKHSFVYDSSVIESGCLRFVITAAPSDSRIEEYAQHLQSFGTKLLIQVCEPGIYSTEHLETSGIEVHNWNFPDGALPPARIVTKWIALLRTLQQQRQRQQNAAPSPLLGSPSGRRKPAAVDDNDGADDKNHVTTVALHCVAGLGRAPMLVAIALIEGGMTPLKAIEHVRKRRQGAFNSKQLQYLLKYKKATPDTCIIL